MTELSDYICAPLNTTTGVISRLEKKKMVERIRGNEDRRVVNIEMTPAAKAFIDEEKKLISFYVKEIYSSLTEEERTAGISIFNKVLSILKNGNTQQNDEDSSKKRVRRITIE